MAAPQASSRLEMLQARFQQKQLQEKEQKLLQLYDQQQQRAYQVAQRGSAGSNGSSSHAATATTTTTTTIAARQIVTRTSSTSSSPLGHTTSTSSHGAKVRQTLNERRETNVKGIDRSYPLEPLENKPRKGSTGNAEKIAVSNARNGDFINVTKQSLNAKRVARADVNSNVNGGKAILSYHEEIVRESSRSGEHQEENEEGESPNENNRLMHRVNGNHAADEMEIRGMDQDTIQRNRMMAKIHLMQYDETMKNRVRNDLESEEFPHDLLTDVSDDLPKKSIGKRLSQAEARFERFKNMNSKRNNNVQSNSNLSSTAARLKGRSEVAPLRRSNSRGKAANAEREVSSGKSTTAKCKTKDRRSETSRTPSTTKTTNIERRKVGGRSGKGATIADRKVDKTIAKDDDEDNPPAAFFCEESERSGTTMSVDAPQAKDAEKAKKAERRRKNERNPIVPSSPSIANKRAERATKMSSSRETSTSRDPDGASVRRGKVARKLADNTANIEDINSRSAGRKSELCPLSLARKRISKDDSSTVAVESTEKTRKPKGKAKYFCERDEKSSATRSIGRSDDAENDKRNLNKMQDKEIEEKEDRRKSCKEDDSLKDEKSSSRNSTSIAEDAQKNGQFCANPAEKESKEKFPSTLLRSAQLIRDLMRSENAKREVASEESCFSNRSRGMLDNRREKTPSPKGFRNGGRTFSWRGEDRSSQTNEEFIVSLEKIRKMAETKSSNGVTSPQPSPKSPKSPKSFTSTEVDTEVHEITMSDQYVRYDENVCVKERKEKRCVSRKTYTKSTETKSLSEELFTYPVKKPIPRKRRSLLDCDVFRSREINAQKGATKGNESVVSLRDLERKSALFERQNSSARSPKTRIENNCAVSLRDITVDTSSKTAFGDGSKEEEQKKDEFLRSTEFLRRAIKSRSELNNSEEDLRYGRTDSVESALRRFDSIGVESEYCGPIGRDTVDNAKFPIAQNFARETSLLPSGEHPETIEKERKMESPLNSKLKSDSKGTAASSSVGKSSTGGTSSLAKERKGNEAARFSKVIKKTPVDGGRSAQQRRTNIKVAQEKQEGKKDEEEAKSGGKEEERKIARAKDRTKMAARTAARSPSCKRKLFTNADECEEKMRLNDTTEGSIRKMQGENVDAEERDAFDRPPSVKPLRSIEDIRKSILPTERPTRTIALESPKKRSLSSTGSAIARERVEKCKAAKFAKQLRPTTGFSVSKENSRVDRTASGQNADSVAKTTAISTRKNGALDAKRVPKESRNEEGKLPRATSTRISAKVSTKSTDCVDGAAKENTLHSQNQRNETKEFVEEKSTRPAAKKSHAFVVDFGSNEPNESTAKRSPPRKHSAEKQQAASSSVRATSSISSASSCNNNGNSNNGGASAVAKGRMAATKAKTPLARSALSSGACADPLLACKVCGRRFAQDRVSLHEQICAKASQKKRKAFDTVMHRVKGTDLEAFAPKKPNPCFPKKPAVEKPKKPDPKSNWRKKHEEFINAIRSAKQVQAHLAAGGKLSDLPPPPVSDTSDYVPCPHCGRRFNEAAAERHIPKCQNMLHNKPSNRAPPKLRR